jgi:putative ABC transport system substrate-binding protein
VKCANVRTWIEGLAWTSIAKLRPIAAVLLVLIAIPIASAVDAGKETARLGVVLTVSSSTAPSAYTIDFWERLRELGWTRGQNLLVEERWAEGHADRMPQLIEEVSKAKVDVILTATEAGARAARKAAPATPTMVMFMGDPMGAGIVSSLSRPGGNLTGLSVQEEGIAGKCLELLKEIVPRLSKVAVIWNPDESFYRRNLGRMQADAASLALRLYFVDVRTARDLEPAFQRARGQTQAVLVLVNPLTFMHRARIASLAARARLPTAFNRSEFVADGGLIAYGANVRAHYKRAAEYVDKLLRGTKAGDLPVEQPTQFDLVINLSTAKDLGLKIPEAMLGRADQVVR